MALAVVATSRIASAPLTLGAALLVPCCGLFAYPCVELRAAVVLMALTTLLLATGSAAPPSSAASLSSFSCYARLALAIDVMLQSSSSAAKPQQQKQQKESVLRLASAAIVRAEGVLFAGMLVYALHSGLLLGSTLPLYPALVLFLPAHNYDNNNDDPPPHHHDHPRPKGPWCLFAMACSTAIGLCAVRDETMEMFLLLSHCALHLCCLPPPLAAATTPAAPKQRQAAAEPSTKTKKPFNSNDSFFVQRFLRGWPKRPAI